MLTFDRLTRLGIGTYLGEETPEDDRGYETTIVAGVKSGLNVIDTAVNYRRQLSERAIGRALERLGREGVPRSSVFVSTKGGYIPGDAAYRGSTRAWFEETLLRPGLVKPEDIVAGCHCIAPGYLSHQIDVSRHNLGVETLDLYYLHNPEQQLDEVDRSEFERGLARAFEVLERAADDGRVRFYGTATWNGYRADPSAEGFLDLERICEIAREVGGDRNRFAAIQAPLNAAMTELASHRNQRGQRSPLRVAADHGLAVFSSASLLQGRLASASHPQAQTDGLTPAQAALRYVLSQPGVTAALVGMKSEAHLQENLGALATPSASSG
ncbi:MAG: aldo/keto reductase [Nitrospirae bacterium]|nr:aldo/keto reductase [Nitrospirota bacterium]